MAISKKDQILQLHNKGYGNDEIIKNGFTKKYVNQVLKGFANSDSNAVPTNTNSIDTLKQLISTVEDLQSKYNQLNINISISIKVDGVKNVSVKSDNPLLNPVTTYRDIGKDGLKDKLLLLSIKDLVKITKTYTPDFSGKIYKKKDANLIIEYLIDRAASLSKVGQVFRTVTTPE